jgi:hypothetical protein
VGRACKAESAAGLDSEMEGKLQESRAGLTARDRRWGRQAFPEDTPPNRTMLKLHSGLRKAESSVLVQAQTGRIVLAKFLYNRRVSGMLPAQCRCRASEETP